MIKPFWFKRPDNYGDILTPFILDSLNIKYQFAEKNKCDSLFIGSIAKLARKGVSIYGSGFIRKADPVSSEANWKFVRGPLSREMVVNSGAKCPDLYGDVALILPEFIKEEGKEYGTVYIPHGVEFDIFPNDKKKIKLYHPDVVFTTKEITKAEKVISSSLHGIIVAHAYGIPAAYVSMSNKLSGDGMKFVDYYRSVGLEPVLSTIENPFFQCPDKIETKHIFEFMEELR